MVNPILKQNEAQDELTITPGAKKIFKALYRSKGGGHVDENIPRLQVSDVISRMAFYYEKIRNAVHYREEHLLRKDAVARILKRQLVIENPININRVDTHAVARHLLIELIRAGYLPNNQLPETRVDETALIIEKYLGLRRAATAEAAGKINFFSAANQKEFASRSELTNWLVGLAAAEIEELIGDDDASRVMVGVMFAMLEKRIELPASLPYESDLQVQVYLAIHRVFMKFDEDMLSLMLLRYYNGDWNSAKPDVIARIAKSLPTVHALITRQLLHPLAGQLDRLIASYNVYFNILKDVIEEDPVAVYDEFFDDPKAFARRIKKSCAKRYASARTKLWRSAWRSIIYILLTKSVFAVLLEIPASELFGTTISPFALIVNITFPALLLFFAVAITKLPGDDNTKKIVAGIEEIVFAEKRKTDPIMLRKPLGRHRFMNFMFGLLYAVTFFISFGAIVWLLESISFSWVSTVIFLFFLAFVSYFIIRIRRNAKEWIVVEGRDSFARFVVDFFSVPIVATGKWLSTRFSRLNVFVFILDFIIEAPFKIFVDIAEEWTKYVRERKDQI